MSWFKVDDKLTHHPKVLALGKNESERNEAIGAWVRLGAYAAGHLTDGRLPAAIVLSVCGSERVRERLVSARWLEKIEVEYAIHDYLDYNPSSEKVKSERAHASGRVSKWRGRNGVSNGVTDPLQHDQCNGVSNAAPVPSRPVTEENRSSADADHVLGLPFSVESALDALAAGGRFVKTNPNKGQSINVVRLIRENPSLVTWTLVGRWLQAGGDSWRQHVDVRALKDFSAWVGHAKAWDTNGRPPLVKSTAQPKAAHRLPTVAEVMAKKNLPEKTGEPLPEEIRAALRKLTG